MTAPEQAQKVLSESAQVDQASVQPFTGSRKIYVSGSRPDLRVPMREISLADTPTEFGGEKNPPLRVYDTSGPYTDPEVSIDLRRASRTCARRGLKSGAIRRFSAAPAQPSPMSV